MDMLLMRQFIKKFKIGKSERGLLHSRARFYIW